MQTFHLQRDEDITGVSGTGKVAEGVVFSDGTVVLRWTAGEHHSTVQWGSLHDVEVIHGHDGRTRIVMHDPVQIPRDPDGHRLDGEPCECGQRHGAKV